MTIKSLSGFTYKNPIFLYKLYEHSRVCLVYENIIRYANITFVDGLWPVRLAGYDPRTRENYIQTSSFSFLDLRIKE